MAKAKAKDEDEGVNIDDDSQEGGCVVDFSNVDDVGEFEAIPRGKYPCVVDSLEFDYSQSKGNPMWTWTLEIEDGEFAGRKLFFHTTFHDKGLPFAKKTLAAVAPQYLESSFDAEAVADSGDLVGIRVTAEVTQKKYEGRMRNNVRGLTASSGSSESFV